MNPQDGWACACNLSVGRRDQESLGLPGQPYGLFSEPLSPVRDPASKHRVGAPETARLLLGVMVCGRRGGRLLKAAL